MLPGLGEKPAVFWTGEALSALHLVRLMGSSAFLELKKKKKNNKTPECKSGLS